MRWNMLINLVFKAGLSMVDFKMQVVIIVNRVYQTNIPYSLKNLQFRMVWIDRLYLGVVHKLRCQDFGFLTTYSSALTCSTL